MHTLRAEYARMLEKNVTKGISLVLFIMTSNIAWKGCLIVMFLHNGCLPKFIFLPKRPKNQKFGQTKHEAPMGACRNLFFRLNAQKTK